MEKFDVSKPKLGGSAQADPERLGWVRVTNSDGELVAIFWHNGCSRIIHRADKGGTMLVFCDQHGGGWELVPVSLPKIHSAIIEAARQTDAFEKASREGRRAAKRILGD